MIHESPQKKIVRVLKFRINVPSYVWYFLMSFFIFAILWDSFAYGTLYRRWDKLPIETFIPPFVHENGITEYIQDYDDARCRDADGTHLCMLNGNYIYPKEQVYLVWIGCVSGIFILTYLLNTVHKKYSKKLDSYGSSSRRRGSNG